MEFKFDKIYYRADKLGKMSLTQSAEIAKNDGWCDDPKSQFYNQHIQFPFKDSAEKPIEMTTYMTLLCYSFNTNPTIAGKGSAIFAYLQR